eukprot:CAMPEP_0181173880 /NCGR_PEP_ID=MMETSP1096-20121128/3235_1 /TAXON_ID=156174 ORGANISM="Chrysochromulina ericina, Strain CCMP281" /NCGR_SAMPLE_ID=MMETSP1096 /ASSEMBLY_ACC=CAM_ASM_000453 /LENGTH=111 /DNA_ID=CAMNT_0023261737 /DNA_START=271 /DNA_END=603 /DNA_ORIENTATION=-
MSGEVPTPKSDSTFATQSGVCHSSPRSEHRYGGSSAGERASLPALTVRLAATPPTATPHVLRSCARKQPGPKRSPVPEANPGPSAVHVWAVGVLPLQGRYRRAVAFWSVDS